MARRGDNWSGKRPRKPSIPGKGGGSGTPPGLGGPGLPGGWQARFSLGYLVVMLLAVSLFNNLLFKTDETIIPYSDFKERVRAGSIARVELGQNYLVGYPPAELRPATTNGRAAGGADGGATRPGEAPASDRKPPIFKTVPVADPGFTALLDEKGVTYSATPKESGWVLGFVLNWILPLAFLFFVWRTLQSRLGGANSNVLAFGQNKATIVAEGDVKTRFKDVAGVDEAKEELVEVIDFLRNPRKYTDIGGKIPKGVLLVGPPGTGKTLIARAVAGEAGVPFFRMSGADFVEMFVGVGAARVRDLFKQAREKAPCIIFIDELDAIGKSRVSGPLGGNDEREQTLNQLLVEMDGFDATSGLIILAATNRPDVLDPALQRPGRFDRQVLVDRPDLPGREAILRIHAAAVKLDETVDLARVARGTPGFVGADLANLVNEAALLAVRAGRKKVSHRDFDAAIEKLIAGLEKKSRVMKAEERRTIAVHETGHALAAAFTPGADPVKKISIVPRGLGALGYTLQLPIEDRFIVTEAELLGQIDVLLGGRAAEELSFGTTTTGAANDLARATEVARRMITDYGMSERYRNVALTRRNAAMLGAPPDSVWNREYSEETQRYIDEEIARVMALRYEKVLSLLRERRSLLDRVAARLLQDESIDEAGFKELLAGEEEASPATASGAPDAPAPAAKGLT